MKTWVFITVLERGRKHGKKKGGEKHCVWSGSDLLCVWKQDIFFFPSMAWFLTGTTDLGAETTLTLWLCSTLTNFFLMYCEWNQVHWDAASVPRTSCGYQENLCLALHFQQCFHCQLSTLTQYLGSLKISQAILSPPYCSDNCWSWSQATLM